MRPKTYHATSVAAAMERIRGELGDDAMIVSIESVGDGVQVTAAVEEAEPAPFALPLEAEPEPSDAPAEIRQALAHHAVPRPLAERLTRTAAAFKREGSLLALAGAFDTLFGFHPLAAQESHKPLMLVGAPGAGKTIAVAKLATLQRRKGRKVTVITTDGRRAGGVEQLEAFTRILGIDLITAPSPEALAEAVAGAEGPVYIDTPGTNPYDDAQFGDLAAHAEAAAAEPVLVLAAGGDAMDAIDLGAAFADLGIRRLLATRLDLTRRFGGLLAAACACRLAFAEVSVSANVTGGFVSINPVSLARLILPHAGEATPQPLQQEAAR
jgi:flagellar biosynthesis protein FlhF